MKVRIVGLGTETDNEVCIFTGELATGYVEFPNEPGEMQPCRLAILGPGSIGQLVEVPKQFIKQNPKVRVIFEYDEQARKWNPIVEGLSTKVEARQAFSAVVITCQQLDPGLLTQALVSDDFVITPAV